MADRPICSIEGCDKKSWARGWCPAHLIRWRRHGDPLAGGTSWGAPARFLDEVVMNHQSDECLEWPFADDGYGGGQIYVDGTVKRVCRVICERLYGPPPHEDYHAAHSCGKGHLKCCNPKHLSWKTELANHQDKITHGTTRRGERCNFAKLTNEQCREIVSLKGKMLQREIAEKYGVSQPNISRIHSAPEGFYG